MHIAACCTHCCLIVTGGKAAACNGVFEHHTPCVDYIFICQAAQRDLISIRCASPSLPCPAPALHALADPLRARTANHPLPRPLQVVIWAISTPTRTSKYPLAQMFSLFCMMLSCFVQNSFKTNAGDCAVVGMRCGCHGGRSVRGCFKDFLHICWHCNHCFVCCSCYL